MYKALTSGVESYSLHSRTLTPPSPSPPPPLVLLFFIQAIRCGYGGKAGPVRMKKESAGMFSVYKLRPSQGDITLPFDAQVM